MGTPNLCQKDALQDTKKIQVNFIPQSWENAQNVGKLAILDVFGTFWNSLFYKVDEFIKTKFKNTTYTNHIGS